MFVFQHLSADQELKMGKIFKTDFLWSVLYTNDLFGCSLVGNKW